MNVEIMPATTHHVRELGQSMRKADAKEAENLGFLPHRLLFRSYKSSLICRAAIIGGEVGGIWGVCGIPMGAVGRPWLVTSNAVGMGSPLDYALLYRQEVRKMAKMFPLLENWVDSTYSEAVRLMRIVGFNVDNPMPHGKNGAMFNRFWLKSELV